MVYGGVYSVKRQINREQIHENIVPKWFKYWNNVEFDEWDTWLGSNKRDGHLNF